MTNLITFGAAIASDVLSGMNIPGGSILSETAARYVESRRTEAAKILIKEIESGHHGKVEFSKLDIDPFVLMTLRFAKAVSDGAAYENLELIAQVIVGLKKNKAFQPDLFRRWCRILEALTRDELLLVGKAHAIALGESDFWKSLQSEMLDSGYTQEEVDAIAMAVSGHGLLFPVVAWAGVGFGPTPWLLELGTLAKLRGINKNI